MRSYLSNVLSNINKKMHYVFLFLEMMTNSKVYCVLTVEESINLEMLDS